jgi:hypothetical protein
LDLTDETSAIRCGKCCVPIKVGAERDGDTWGSCPFCGQEDRVDNIIREAAEYSLDNMVSATLSGFQEGELTVKSPPLREYRWITRD